MGYTWGNFSGNNLGKYDLFLIKLNSDGEEQWRKQWGTTEIDTGRSIVLNNNNIYIIGFTQGSFTGFSNLGTQDIFLTKIKDNGNIQWTKQWGTNGADRGNSIVVNDDSIYVTGSTDGYLGSDLDGNNLGHLDIFLTKLTLDGIKEWTKQWGTTENDAGNSITIDNNHIYITGLTEGTLSECTSAGNSDIFLTKLALDGVKVWTKQWGTSSNDAGNSVIVLNNNIYVTGTQINTADTFLTKIEDDGNILWTKHWGRNNNKNDSAMSITKDNSSNLYITGHTNGDFGDTPVGDFDAFLIKITTINIEN